MTLSDHLLTLELQLLTPTIRTNPAALLTLLTPDFRDFGSSGLTYTREDILHVLGIEIAFTPPEITNFEARELTPTLALITYTSTRPEGPNANRSSLWTLRENRWQLLFHQGTRIP